MRDEAQNTYKNTTNQKIRQGPLGVLDHLKLSFLFSSTFNFQLSFYLLSGRARAAPGTQIPKNPFPGEVPAWDD